MLVVDYCRVLGKLAALSKFNQNCRIDCKMINFFDMWMFLDWCFATIATSLLPANWLESSHVAMNSSLQMLIDSVESRKSLDCSVLSIVGSHHGHHERCVLLSFPMGQMGLLQGKDLLGDRGMSLAWQSGSHPDAGVRDVWEALSEQQSTWKASNLDGFLRIF